MYQFDTLCYKYSECLRFMPTTMKVSKETLDRLRGHGKMGDTFEAVVTRLLDDCEDEELEDVDEEDDDKV